MAKKHQEPDRHQQAAKSPGKAEARVNLSCEHRDNPEYNQEAEALWDEEDKSRIVARWKKSFLKGTGPAIDYRKAVAWVLDGGARPKGNNWLDGELMTKVIKLRNKLPAAKKKLLTQMGESLLDYAASEISQRKRLDQGTKLIKN